VNANPAPSSNSGQPLVPGTYTGAVTITAPLAGNTPVSIPVTLTVVLPTITANPSSVSVTTAVQVTQTVTFTTNGANSPFTASANVTNGPPGWLSVAPTSGNTSGSATITINPAGSTPPLGPGTYTGIVQFALSQAFNPLIVVPVTLTVPPFQNCVISLDSSSTSLPGSGTATASGGLGLGFLPESPVTFHATEGVACAPVAWTVAVTPTGTDALSLDTTWLKITSNRTGSGAGPFPVSFVALVNTHVAARSAAITVTNTATGATSVYTVHEAASQLPVLNREVVAEYQRLLGRDPDSGGYNFWACTGTSSATCSGLGASATLLGTEGDAFLTQSEGQSTNWQVMISYRAALGRFATYAEFAAAVNAMRSTTGALTPTQLYTNLINSTEYQTNFGSPSNNTLFVTTLYMNLLGRAPSTTELNTAVAALTGGTQTQFGLFTSLSGGVGCSGVNTTTGLCPSAAEYQNVSAGPNGTIDHSNADYITMLYFVVLERDPDVGGRNFWIGVANGGGPGLYFKTPRNGNTPNATRFSIEGNGNPGSGFFGSVEYQGLFNP